MIYNLDRMVLPQRTRGRPRRPLLAGQAFYTEAAYRTRSLPQADISLHVRAALPRIRRHLTALGLYRPVPGAEPAVRLATMRNAIERYLNGDKVLSICDNESLSPAELYKILHAFEVPLRSQLPEPVANAQESE